MTKSPCWRRRSDFPLPDLTDKPPLKAKLDGLGERLAEHDLLTMTKL